MKGILGAIIGIIVVIVINLGYRYYTTSGADTYLVVDLSKGPSAKSYPVSKLSDVPEGGWTDEYKTTKLVLRKITAGKMPRTDVDITLTKDYYIGVFEVTQAQWELVMGSNPSQYRGNTQPVETVSYEDIRGSSNGSQWPASNAVDATSFMGKLRAKTDIDFDLPTEAQWEYACRAGSSGDYGFISDGIEGTLAQMAWRSVLGSPTEVGLKTPNMWGIYDMHGNIWEWCLDWRDKSTYEGIDPVGALSATARVLRGGSFNTCTISHFSAYDLNASTSPSNKRDNYIDTYGFRVAICHSKNDEDRSLNKKEKKSVKQTPAKQGTIKVAGIDMVRIPDSTTHKGLYFGKYEVTQAQWQSIMGDNPSHFEGDLSRPVECVSWNECQKFIKKLNARSEVKKAGLTFFLPTEEQWEYACRAGSKGKYGLLADGREGSIDEMGWYDDNSGRKTHPVGQKKPNAWGLYDMHGNVEEWTASSDCYGGRIFRGGSWSFSAGNCEAGLGGDSITWIGHAIFGFRLAASRTEK